MIRAYIAGPMSSDPVDFNFPVFDAAKQWVIERTPWAPVSPADITREKWGDPTSKTPEHLRFKPEPHHYQAFLRLDVAELATCNYILFLPGWRESPGARKEAIIARWLGIEPGELLFCGTVPTTVEWASIRGEDSEIERWWRVNAVSDVAPILVTKVHTDRPKVTSENMLKTVDALVSDTRQKEYGHPADNFERMAALWSTITGANIEPRLVPLMLIALKIAREVSSHQPDNYADAAGYAKTALMAQEKWDAESEF